MGGQVVDGAARVDAVWPIENELHSPVRFRMAPEAQVKAYFDFDERGQELVAIFHSHPNGPDRPSETDIAEFAYPGVLTLICVPSAAQSGWSVRAFMIAESQVDEVVVAILPANLSSDPPDTPPGMPPGIPPQPGPA